MKRLLLALPFLLVACSNDLTTSPTTMNTPATPANVAQNTPRYQILTTEYSLLVAGSSQHYYTFVMNPCDGSIMITGRQTNPGAETDEVGTGTLANGIVSYHAVYLSYIPGYNYDATFAYPVPSAGEATLSLNTFLANGTSAGPYGAFITQLSTSSSSYKNHGEFVSGSADKNDAAHLCIGMPIVSHQ